MRTCPAFSTCGHLAYYSRRGVGHDLSWFAARKAAASVYSHFYATAAIAHRASPNPSVLRSPFASSVTQPQDKLGHASTLTALHKTRELMTRVLPPQSPELSFWNDILRDVSDETCRSSLTSTGEKITIVVYSVDEFSGGEALVSALLQDPFSPEAENVRITGRWEGHEQDTRLDIECAKGASPTSSRIIHLSSSFLTSLPSSVRLIEVRQSRELSQDHLRLLYTAHIPIVLLNPLTTPLTALSPYATSDTKSTVLPYPLPPHALLLFTSPSPISTSSSVPPSIFELGVSPDRVFLVDPARALSSIHALRTNPSDALHVQRYADDAVGSGLSALKRQLQSVPTAMQKGDALGNAAVGVLRNGLSSAEAELGEAASLARALRSEAERAHEDAQRAVFGPAHEPVRLTPSAASQQPAFKTGTTNNNNNNNNNNKVRAAMTHADSTVQPVLDNLTWWRVLWAPDDVGWRMRQAVRDAWVGGIASGLLPALAALPSTQSRLADSARERVATALPPALRSRVLLNALEQRAHAPTFAVEPSALLTPLERRLARLDAGPTALLARAAQVLVLRIAGSIGAGVGAGALVLAHGVGEATGAGLFVAAAGVRWAIGRWDKARRAWRADWVRVKEAAERDVQTALDEALETQVLIVPVHAADGVEEIIAKREDDIEQMRQEVDKLDAEVSGSQNLADRGDIHS
ncbi:hypothetical protein BJY52DRAFT_1121925 [Lactarius psammicola]|nr:hypothetical protein BJY52DRAFT_1121925 [Lactarius psammicola]